MSRSMILTVSLAGAALAAGGLVGWWVLAPAAPPGPLAGSSRTDEALGGDPGGTGADTAAGTGSSGVAKAVGDGPEIVNGDEDSMEDLPGDEGLDRVPHGPEGGVEIDVQAMENLIKEGRWQDVERMLREAGGSADPRVTDLLLAALGDERFRNFAEDLFKLIRDPGAREKLLTLAGGDAHEWTRAVALKAAAHIGGDGVQDAILAALRTGEPGGVLMNVAAGALALLDTPEAARALVDLLRDPSLIASRASFTEALGKMTSPTALTELSRLVAEDGEDPALRLALVKALGQAGGRALEASADILRMVRDTEDADLRRAGYLALAQIGEPSGVQALLDAVAGGDNGDKFAAAIALQSVRKGDQGAATAIEGLVRSASVDPAMRPYLVTSLGSIGSASSVKVLGEIVSDADESSGVRNTALRSLGQIGGPEARDILIKTLEKESDPAMRRTSISSLGTTSTSEDLPRLKEIRASLKDGSFDAQLMDVLIIQTERLGSGDAMSRALRSAPPTGAPASIPASSR